MGLQTGLLTGFSSWLKTRDGKHHTQKLPWAYICHQDGFHRGTPEASFRAQNTLDFCQKYRSCPHSITSNWSLPLVNCFLSTIWICPVLAKLSTALTPALISLLPLSQHPVCLESHMTSICLLCQSNLSKICSDHSPDQHFAIFPNSHGREFSNCQTSQSDIPGPTSRESYLRQDGVIAPRIYIFNELVRWFRCVRTLPSSLNCSLSSGISWPSLLPLTSANAPMSPLNYPSLSMSG